MHHTEGSVYIRTMGDVEWLVPGNRQFPNMGAKSGNTEGLKTKDDNKPSASTLGRHGGSLKCF